MFLKRHFYSIYRIQWWKEYLKTRIHLLVRYKTPKYTVELAALRDAYNEKLGIHDIYNPGWNWKEN